jgi:hypothetical protein
LIHFYKRNFKTERKDKMSEASLKQETREDEAERLHFQKVVNSFKVYKQHSLRSIKKREDFLSTLPAEHQKLLRKNGYENLLSDLKLAVDANNEIMRPMRPS